MPERISQSEMEALSLRAMAETELAWYQVERFGEPSAVSGPYMQIWKTYHNLSGLLTEITNNSNGNRTSDELTISDLHTLQGFTFWTHSVKDPAAHVSFRFWVNLGMTLTRIIDDREG